MRAVDKVDGLEWLTEWDEYDIAADEDFYIEEHPEKPLSGRLYLVMSNHAGFPAHLVMGENTLITPITPSSSVAMPNGETVPAASQCATVGSC